MKQLGLLLLCWVGLNVFSVSYCQLNLSTQIELAKNLTDRGEDVEGDTKKRTYFLKASEIAKDIIGHAPERWEGFFYQACAAGNLAKLSQGKEKLNYSRNIESFFKKTLEITPNYVPAIIGLGSYYRAVAQENWVMKLLAKTVWGTEPVGTYAMAINKFEEARLLEPNKVRPLFELGKTYELLGNPKKAISYFEQLIRLGLFDHEDKKLKKYAIEYIQKRR